MNIIKLHFGTETGGLNNKGGLNYSGISLK